MVVKTDLLHCNKGSWSIPSWMCTFYLHQSPHRPLDPCSDPPAVWPQSLSHSPETKRRIIVCCAFEDGSFLNENILGSSYLVIYRSARTGFHLDVWF